MKYLRLNSYIIHVGCLHDAITQALSAGNKTVARAIAKAFPEIELELPEAMEI